MKDENDGREKQLDSAIVSVDFQKCQFSAIKKVCPDVFSTISFHLEKGDRALLQGDNGSGKNDIGQTVAGIVSFNFGNNFSSTVRMRLQSTATACGSILALFHKASFCSVEPSLITFCTGRKKKKRQDVENLIDNLGLQDYISRLPKGLDTEISQNTSGVSGRSSADYRP